MRRIVLISSLVSTQATLDVSNRGVKFENIQIEKMKYSNFPIPLLTPEKILEAYNTVVVGGSEELKKWSDNAYVLTLFRTLCDLTVVTVGQRTKRKCFLYNDSTLKQSAQSTIRNMMARSSLIGFSTRAELNDELSRWVQDDPPLSHIHMAHGVPSKSNWFKLGLEQVPRELFNLIKKQSIPAPDGLIERFREFFKSYEIMLTTPGKLDYTYTTRIASSYVITERPEWSIQYSAMCDDRGQIKNVFYMQKLHLLRISPNVYYYSDRMKSVPLGESGKIPHLPSCSNKLSIRYTVMDTVGDSLEKYATGHPQRLENAMRIGIQLVSILQKLHSQNIVHGNIAWENVMFRSNDLSPLGDGGYVYLMNFVDSEIFQGDETTLCQQREYHPQMMRSSPNGDCEKISFVDEVFFAVLISVDVMYGGKLSEFLKSKKDQERVRLLMSAGEIFEIESPLSLDSMKSDLGKIDKEWIREEFRTITREIESRNQKNSLEKPDYEKIITSYRNIIQILVPSTLGVGGNDPMVFWVDRNLRLDHLGVLNLVSDPSIYWTPISGVWNEATLSRILGIRMKDKEFFPTHPVHSKMSRHHSGQQVFREDIPIIVYNNLVPSSTIPGGGGGGPMMMQVTLTPIDEALYSIREIPNTFLKYYAWCYSDGIDGSIDPLIRNVFFMERLAPTRMCPSIYYYSDAEVKNPTMTLELSNLHTQPICEGEISGRIPHIRYLIMEAYGPTIDDYVVASLTGKRRFLNIIKLGAQMILILKQLHGWNIVHRKIDVRAFALSRQNLGRLVLLEYNFAYIHDPLDSFIATKNFCPPEDESLHPTIVVGETSIEMSKWELQGCEPIFRDDVYRAVQNVAFLMFGEELISFFKSRSMSQDGASRDWFTEVKSKAKFFDIQKQSGGTLQIPKLKSRKTIERHLAAISAEVSRERAHQWEKPDYDFILDRYKNIIRLLDPSPPSGIETDHMFDVEIIASAAAT